MQTPGRVSIWAGKFADEAELEEYALAYYKNDDDEGSAIMWDDMGIDWFDDDFQEIAFYENPITADDLREFSYADSFAQHMNPEELKGFNALVLLYDFQPDAGKDNSDLKFIGTFGYTQ